MIGLAYFRSVLIEFQQLLQLPGQTLTVRNPEGQEHFLYQK